MFVIRNHKSETNMAIKPNIIAGLILCVVIGLLAKWLNQSITIGSVALAILLGILIRNVIKLPSSFTPGIIFSEKKILSFAIVLMGVNLNYTVLKHLGFKSLALIVIALTLTILVAVILGQVFKFNSKLAWLIGIGSGVCGSAAIAATEKIIDANETDVGLSIASINFLGTLGLFGLPILGTTLFHDNHMQSGILIGNTIQAVGHVVASAFLLSPEAGQTALVIKMARVLMLTPLVFLLIAFCAKKASSKTKKKTAGIPFFIIGFVLMSLIPTFNLLPESAIKIISQTSKYALMVAMAGIGLKITFASILKEGKAALLLGVLVFAFQIALNGIAIWALF